VLGRVPTGRLVVLGEPGAGKTVLLVRLVLDLLARRRPGGPVPVLLPLASWDPAGQRLRDWAAGRMALDYPGLAAPDRAGSGVNTARALLDAGLVVPVFDGLDELAVGVRAQALVGIDEAVPAGVRLVLASRADCYRQVVEPPDGGGVRLAGTAGVTLCPLRTADVATYLLDSAAGLDGRARWARVLDALAAPASSRTPLAQVLTTPLAAGLARAVYNSRPDEPASGLPDPAELLDADRFPTADELRNHLFDGYLPAVYRPHPDPARSGRWTSADARRWLAFLARHLEDDRAGTPDLAWWDLVHAFGPRRRALTMAFSRALPAPLARSSAE
jgi:hypothetical protein